MPIKMSFNRTHPKLVEEIAIELSTLGPFTGHAAKMKQGWYRKRR